MGLIPEFIQEFRRERLMDKLNLFGRELNERIEVVAEAIEEERGPSPLATLLAISQIEDELLEEHYRGGSLSKQMLIWHTIVEALHYKRLETIPDEPLLSLPLGEAERLKKKLQTEFFNLRAATKESSPSPTLNGLHLVERAMWECITEGGPDNPALFCIWIRKILWLGYEAKVEVLNFRTP